MLWGCDDDDGYVEDEEYGGDVDEQKGDAGHAGCALMVHMSCASVCGWSSRGPIVVEWVAPRVGGAARGRPASPRA